MKIQGIRSSSITAVAKTSSCAVILAFATITPSHAQTLQWHSMNGPYGDGIRSVGTNGRTWIAGTHLGLYRSTDRGESWTMVYSASPNTSDATAIATNGSIMYAGFMTGGIDGLVESSDDGRTWLADTNVHLNFYSRSIVTSGSTVFADAVDSIFVSVDSAKTWTRISPSWLHWSQAMIADDSGIFVGSDNAVYYSKDRGASWIIVDTMAADGATPSSFLLRGDTILAGWWNGRIRRSTDRGASWHEADSGLQLYSPNGGFVYSNGVLLTVNAGSVYSSTNLGTAWNKERIIGVHQIALDSSALIAGTCEGVFKSTDLGQTWNQCSIGLKAEEVHSIAGFKNCILASGFCFGVFRSCDNGNSWQRFDDSLSDLQLRAMVTIGSEVFGVLASCSGVIRSSDSGATWQELNANITDSCSGLLVSDRADLYYVGYDNLGWANGVFRSTNNGEVWRQVDSGIGPRFLAAQNGFVFIESDKDSTGSWFYYSSNSGDSWTRAKDSLLGADFLALAINDSTFFVSKQGGVWRSEGFPFAWQKLSGPDDEIFSFAAFQSTIICDGRNGVYLSTDDGVTWQLENNGLPNQAVHGLTVVGNSLYAATRVGIYETDLSAFATVPPTAAIASKTNLRAYPNPASGISYFIADGATGEASITIFDPLGRISAKTVVGERMDGGQRVLPIDVSCLVPGVYTARVETGGSLQLAKFVVAR